MAVAVAAQCFQGNIVGFEHAIICCPIKKTRELHAVVNLSFPALVWPQVTVTLESPPPLDAFWTIAAAIPVWIVIGTKTRPLNHRNDAREMKNEKRKKHRQDDPVWEAEVHIPFP
jgi:hypothetical protein